MLFFTQKTTNEKLYALLGRWLDPKQGDGKTSVEVPLGDKDGVSCLPLQRYTIEVKTGDRRGAGTDANVKFTLYGDKGESPTTTLNNARDNFERNKMDQFDFECVDVGKLILLIVLNIVMYILIVLSYRYA